MNGLANAGGGGNSLIETVLFTNTDMTTEITTTYYTLESSILGYDYIKVVYKRYSSENYYQIAFFDSHHIDFQTGERGFIISYVSYGDRIFRVCRFTDETVFILEGLNGSSSSNKLLVYQLIGVKGTIGK